MSNESPSSIDMVRREVVFSGRVQGVGFRQTTRSLARGRPVTGYVRNLPNGTVELIVEGERAVVEAFLSMISQTMARNIVDVRIRELEATGEFDAFEIRW